MYLNQQVERYSMIGCFFLVAFLRRVEGCSRRICFKTFLSKGRSCFLVQFLQMRSVPQKQKKRMNNRSGLLFCWNFQQNHSWILDFFLWSASSQKNMHVFHEVFLTRNLFVTKVLPQFSPWRKRSCNTQSTQNTQIAAFFNKIAWIWPCHKTVVGEMKT